MFRVGSNCALQRLAHRTEIYHRAKLRSFALAGRSKIAGGCACVMQIGLPGSADNLFKLLGWTAPRRHRVPELGR